MTNNDLKMINRAALFSSGADEYVEPLFFMPGEEVTVRLRTAAGNVDSAGAVFVLENDVTIYRTMTVERTEGRFDYWSVSQTVPEKPLRYYFDVSAGKDRCCYLCGGFEDEPKEELFFTLVPGYRVPEWALGAVMYQIFPDRFCNGDPSNDVRTGDYLYNGEHPVRALSWEADVETEDYDSFRGGDLKGIMEKLLYLRHIGVEALYLNPIFKSPSSHKYDTSDYEHIDPHFGTDEDFAKLMRLCREAGIRVILDGVFNHCGIENKKIVDQFGAKEFWWNVKTLPKLEYESSPGLEEYIFDAASKWLRGPYFIDGWRLDVAADLGKTKEFNIGFWQRFKKRVLEENPEALVLAEHYGDPSDWIRSMAWDTVMNYDGFMEPVSFFFTGMEKHSYEARPELRGNAGQFFYAMRRWQAKLPYGAVLSAMDQLDNHDHSRFLTRTNKKAGTLKDCGSRAAEKGTDLSLLIAAAAVQVTWPGSPCIYYGDEAGLCGWTDPDSRRPFPWGRENTKVLDIYTYLCRMSHDPVLRLGSWIELYAAHDALAFGRFYRGRGTVTAVNIGPERLLMKIELWRLGCPESAQVRRVLEAGEGVYNVGRLKRAAPGGILELHLKPGSVQILTVG